MRIPKGIYRRLPRRITRLLDAYQIWDEQLDGWLSRMVLLAVSLGGTLWTWLGESWLPMAFVAGLGLYILIPKVLAAALDRDRSLPVSTGANGPPHPAFYADGPETELMHFFLDYILPTVLAQKELQEELITFKCEDRAVRAFARWGITAQPGPISEFWRSFSALWGAFSSSPIEYVPLHEQIKHIRRIEERYAKFVEQADQVAAGVDYRRHPRFCDRWDDWRNKHDLLKKNYDIRIKRNPQFLNFIVQG